MKRKKLKVYLIFLNYKNEITNKVLIAEFYNESWAMHFLNDANKNKNDNYCKFIIEI